MTMMTPLPHRSGGDSEAPAVWAAEDLLAGHDTATIRLGDQCYVLRLTRAGKLILTK